jgi:hypothetical protein
MSFARAQEILGNSFIGPEELMALDGPLSFEVATASSLPFLEEELRRNARSHFLVYAPQTYADGHPVTINSLRNFFGVDPKISEPCMYDQDWYLSEEFADTTSLDGRWHLLRRDVLAEARARPLDEVRMAIGPHEVLPTAVTCAFAFFAYWLHSGGERLWRNDFLWCSDRDHNGDPIYVGRYEDPDGFNKNGFNIHRHLSIRHIHSAAPETVR